MQSEQLMQMVRELPAAGSRLIGMPSASTQPHNFSHAMSVPKTASVQGEREVNPRHAALKPRQDPDARSVASNQESHWETESNHSRRAR